MSRNVVQTMSEIFDALISAVSDEDQCRIADVKRHIRAEGDEEPVCEFVAKAKTMSFLFNTELLCLFEFRNQRYLLISEKFSSSLIELGLDTETDIAITQGAAMLAIAKRSLHLRKETTSLLIIERCLGIMPEDPNETNITFDFSVITTLFAPYCVVRLDDSRFPLIYHEDMNRLMCYLIADFTPHLSRTAKASVKQLTLMLSSRSIAASMINGIQNLLVEYTYLQFYQCIEYLFKLNNCFLISEGHNIPLETSMSIVLAHELKTSESENLYQVLVQNASESSIDTIIGIMSLASDQIADKYKTASNYIYRLRCNIAHLRYDQDDFSHIDWEKYTEALIEVLLSIYQKRDSDIVQVCASKGTWKNIIME